MAGDDDGWGSFGLMHWNDDDRAFNAGRDAQIAATREEPGTRCHLCKTSLVAQHVSNEGRTGPLHTVACQACGLVQTLPHPTAEEVAAYYASGAYRQEFRPLPVYELDANLEPTGRMVDPGSPDYETALDRAGVHTAKRLIRDYAIAPTDRVLEVGCGDGRVAAAFAEAGVCTMAIEADPNKRLEAQARGVRAEEPHECSGHDFVYALQVAEHFADPVRELHENIVRHAKIGGVVVVEVPTVERPYVSLSHFLQKPHVVNYSGHTLQEAMWAAGLDEARTRIEGSVLIGEGIRSADGPRKRPPGYQWPGPSGTEVAAALKRWEHDREHSRGAIVRRFMEGEDLDPAALQTIREEFALWSETAERAVRGMGLLCKAIDDQPREDWHADPWVRGYLAGRIYEGQRLSRALDHVNGDVMMFLNRDRGEK